jgi:hypothetical protein
MVDRHLPVRLQREVLIRKGERRVERAARQVIENALALADKAFDRATATFDNAVLQADDIDLTPLLDTIGGIHSQAAQEQANLTNVTLLARADPAEAYARRALRYLATVRNRLVGTSDAVWEALRAELATGIARGESIANLSLRIDDALAWTGAPNWKARATTIARTETIGAYNNGHLDGARANQDTFGDAVIYKTWLATGDDKTRDTHAEAEATYSADPIPIDEYFAVGGDTLDSPGDPAGSPEEVINCRCTMLFLYPGDPDYPGEATGDKYEQALAAAPPPPLGSNPTPSEQLAFDRWAIHNPEAAFAYRRAEFGGVYDVTLPESAMRPLAAAERANRFYGTPNCTNCVTAWDMRMRGLDVVADKMPSAHHSMWDLLGRWVNGPNELRDLGNPAGNAYEWVSNEIRWNYGTEDGWGFISVQWKEGGAHVFGWTKHGNSIGFYEPQSGRVYAKGDIMWRHINHYRPSIIARTSHLPAPTGEGVHHR